VPRLLLVNPNTSVAVTGQLVEHVRAALGPSVEIVAATARFGAAYIASETSYAIAAHAVLDSYAQFGRDCDAVLIGCFGDPGAFAMRELTPVPVIGLAEAAMREAARHGRFAIVTGGARWRVMLQRLAESLGLAEQLAAIHLVERTGAQLAADPVAARRVLADACRRAAADRGIKSVILGGAALAGMAEDFAATLDLPLIDSVTAGATAIGAALTARPAADRAGDGLPYRGLSAELQALLGR
jgi:allantoin racemase